MPTDYQALIRGYVRIDLHDEDATNYRWTDATLNRHIAQAVKELSFHIPREVKTTLDTVASSRDITLPVGVTDLVEIAAVEYPAGNFPRTYVRYSLWNNVLTLMGEDIPAANGEDVYLYWYQLHTLDTTSTTLPTWTYDLVALGAAAMAAIEWASYATNRVNVGGEATWKNYLSWGTEALKQFREEIARKGRKGSVRSSSLFAPSAPAQSQSTDPGPQ